MKTYSEKLKDPRWQKKRLQILERDKWQYIDCGESLETLYVHHLAYKYNVEPWDYPDGNYVTLCGDCHSVYHGLGCPKDVAESLKDLYINGLSPLQVAGCVKRLEQLTETYGYDAINSVLHYFVIFTSITTEDGVEEIIKSMTKKRDDFLLKFSTKKNGGDNE